MSFSSSMSKQQVLEVAGDEVGGGGGEEVMELIPGLPEEVAEKCLLHLPFLYHRLFRTVSSTWNRFLTVSPAKFPSAAAASVSLSLPFLFAFAFDPASRRLQCQALDPFSRRWLLLPPVPGGAAAAGSFAVVGLPRRGEIYVTGRRRCSTRRKGGGPPRLPGVARPWRGTTPRRRGGSCT